MRNRDELGGMIAAAIETIPTAVLVERLAAEHVAFAPVLPLDEVTVPMAPMLVADTDDILREAGHDDDAIAALRAAGVVS